MKQSYTWHTTESVLQYRFRLTLSLNVVASLLKRERLGRSLVLTGWEAAFNGQSPGHLATQQKLAGHEDTHCAAVRPTEGAGSHSHVGRKKAAFFTTRAACSLLTRYLYDTAPSYTHACVRLPTPVPRHHPASTSLSLCHISHLVFRRSPFPRNTCSRHIVCPAPAP